ncbi:alpha/beta hydrolase family protein [Hymenobacter sp. DG25A]|uniref:alpha/beta hydrolase family protein n=1 Tax=Hymenobacter sp. DG25A TaxID=1385663 RepID=UPI0006BC46D0|nr:alpha/beta fold hydrolase [Hymenobacter sp. DG25A]ALD21832.1 hypothetical protein AM218_12250 [Hymenobacter sp. DG25A]
MPGILLAGPEDPKLNGQWSGMLKVAGTEMEMIVTIVPLSTGGYYAALDIPKQKISRMPMKASLTNQDVLLKIDQAGSRFTGKLNMAGTEMKGTWQQPGITGPLVLKRISTSILNAAFKAAPPYRREEVIVPNKPFKLRLGATLTMPNGAGPFPAVALVSDLGAQDRDASQEQYRMFAILADYLTRQGFAVLRYDDRGVGQSNGRYYSATTADLVTDAQAAMGFLRAHYRVKKNQVGLIGHGEGANIALLAAAQPKGPDFVVSLAGSGQTGQAVMQQQQVEILRLIGANANQVKSALALDNQMVNVIRQTPDDKLARAKVGVLLRQINNDLAFTMVQARVEQLTSPWYRYYLDFNPVSKLHSVKCPVLAMNGTADLQVMANKNLSLLHKGLRNSRKVTIVKLPGVNHLFQPDRSEWALINNEQQPVFAPKALATMDTWLKNRTKTRTSFTAPIKAKLAAPLRKPAPDKTASR